MQAILDLEDRAPDILFETASGNGPPLWASVRTRFAGEFAENELNDVAAEQPVSTWGVRRRALRAQLPSPFDVSRLRNRRRYCYLVGGGTLHLTDRGVRNWLIGDAADAMADESVILQWAPLPSALGSPAFHDTWSLDPLDARADLRARLSPLAASVESSIRRLITAFSGMLDAAIEPHQVNRIAEAAISAERRRRWVDHSLSRVLDRVQPEVAVVEDASYGQWANVVVALKRNGVRVVEPQHGWIGSVHPAYNFGAAMHREPLRLALPDVLLTFGEYWSERIRHPARSVAVGKPHLDATVRRAAPLEERPKRLLIVSSVSEPERLEEFVIAVRALLPQDWTVSMRVHPSERGLETQRYPRLAAVGIEWDPHLDAYDSLLEARGVVGVSSTMLYEALAFGGHVFTLDSGFADYYADEILGERIDPALGAVRVAARVQEAHIPAQDAARLARVWKSDAAASFVAALRDG